MYQRVMVPLDGSELAECVLPHAAALADGMGVSSVVLVRVIEPYVVPYDDNVDFSFKVIEMEKQAENTVDQKHIAEARNYLDNVAQNFAVKAELDKVVLLGKPAAALVDYAAQNSVDLVVISTHGRSGVQRWLRGSVAERILQSICAPVFMIRAPGCIAGL